MLKRTPLFAIHQQLGARLVEFGGWEMPVQYTSIVDEHQAVRTAAGLFDISHMGEIFISGPAALDFLNRVLTNDLRKCEVGRGQYTIMCYPSGGVVDDLYVYQIEPMGYLLIVNASRIPDDTTWLEQQLAAFPGQTLVTMVNASQQRGAVAVQGPRVAQFVDQCFSGPALAGAAVSKPTDLKKNQLAAFLMDGNSVWTARTGYTGEDGFELIAPTDLVQAAWQKLFAAGQEIGLKACGLGARDTLRTEMCYPLYGHELDEQKTPIEAGLSAFVSLEKGEFVGRSVLAQQKASGVQRKCVAFRMTTRSAPPRPHYSILSPISQQQVGEVVSGTQSPSLGVGIGLGYVPPELARPGTTLWIEIRGKAAPAEVVPKPFYRKSI